MKNLPALLITVEAVKQDSVLQSGHRGARKLLVTGLYPEQEVEAKEVVWSPPSGADKCPVQVMENIELAVFNQHTVQDRHHHKLATEFYTVLDGRMRIEVAGLIYALAAGDTMVMHPGTVHEVLPAGCEFTCQVITANTSGISDKYLN